MSGVTRNAMQTRYVRYRLAAAINLYRVVSLLNLPAGFKVQKVPIFADAAVEEV